MLGSAALFSATLLGGCQDPLATEGSPRTPYDRYRELRGEQRPTIDESPPGAAPSDRPALRERLRPLDQY